MKRKIEVTVIQSGQSRLYADGITLVRMKFQMKAIRRTQDEMR